MATDAQLEPTNRKPKRRWLQFGISTLLLLTLVCAVGLALIVVPAERQRRAVNYVESVGGRVSYNESHLGPEWLRKVLGNDYFQTVSRVTLSPSERTQVSDAGMENLEKMTGLTWLNLGGTHVSDTGLVHLKGLRALKTLFLNGTRVSDAGLVHLKGLTALEYLFLDETRVSDTGLVHLKGLRGLKTLSLIGTRVSDAGLAHLKGLTALKELDLSYTHLSDTKLAHIQGLPSLDLASRWVSNSNVVHLNGETPVSDAGIAVLQQALPHCWIKTVQPAAP